MEKTDDIDLMLILNPHGWKTCFISIKNEIVELEVTQVFIVLIHSIPCSMAPKNNCLIDCFVFTACQHKLSQFTSFSKIRALRAVVHDNTLHACSRQAAMHVVSRGNSAFINNRLTHQVSLAWWLLPHRALKCQEITDRLHIGYIGSSPWPPSAGT